VPTDGSQIEKLPQRARLLAILSAAALLMSCGALSPPSRRAADGFLNLLKHGRLSDAQAKLSAGYRRSLIAEFGGLRNEALAPEYQAPNLFSYEIVPMDISEDSATAHVKIVGKDGATHHDDIELVREGGQWRISGL